MSLVRLVRSHSPPGRDHLDVGLQRVIAKLEADLVITLAGRAMGDGIGADHFRDLDLPPGESGRAIDVPSR